MIPQRSLTHSLSCTILALVFVGYSMTTCPIRNATSYTEFSSSSSSSSAMTAGNIKTLSPLLLQIFVSATSASNNFDHHRRSAINNKRVKQALQSRSRRRQLFKAVLDEHYHELIDLAVNNGSDNGHGDGDKMNRNGVNVSKNECLYYNKALTDPSTLLVTMSDWTIEICLGQSISKLKLSPLDHHLHNNHKNNDDGSKKKYNTKAGDMININGKSYHIQQSHTLGLYIDKSTMTHEDYNQEIYKFWGQQFNHFNLNGNHSNHGDEQSVVDKSSSSLWPDFYHYYSYGDYTCLSPISRTNVKSAVRIQTMNTLQSSTSSSTLSSLLSCCPENIHSSIGRNYFPNQITNDGQHTILNITQSHTCRYTIVLCKFCRPNAIIHDDDGNHRSLELKESDNILVKNSKNNNNDDDDSMDTYHEFQRNIVDFFTLNMDNDKNKQNSDNSNANITSSSHLSWTKKSFPPMPPSRIKSNLRRLKSMFTHAYDSYMYNAYPASELKPLSCQGGTFDLVRLPALTLIDSLDTLLIMKNYTEFARSVERLRDLDSHMKKINPEFGNSNRIDDDGPTVVGGIFAVNQNVSLFETNIRVLGGLLSAHQMANVWMKNQVFVDDVYTEDKVSVLIGPVVGRHVEKSNILQANDKIVANPNGKDGWTMQQQPCMDPFSDMIPRQSLFDGKCSSTSDGQVNATNKNDIQQEEYWSYDGFLLTLAHDIGRRLLPAFESKTGIPYGTVNLLYGIPHGETPIASLAGAGSLSIEMELLSRLTGDPIFGKAAKLATRALWIRRSGGKSLLGKHIDIDTGRWTETTSGIGSNSDSFYEYLLKHYILFPEDDDFYDMFQEVYGAIFKHGRQGDWYPDVDMSEGLVYQSSLFESLAAFYPGLQVLLGEFNPSTRSENSFMSVREQLGFLPERYNYNEWAAMLGHAHHPLRPELHESCYFIHMGTKDITSSVFDSSINATSSWLWSADFAIRELESKTKTDCGYGVVGSVKEQHSSVLQYSTRTDLRDEMPSFFLSETLKYFYLAFDSNNPLNIDKERDWVFTTEAHPIHYAPRVRLKAEQDANKSYSNQYDDIRNKVIKKLNSRLKNGVASQQLSSQVKFIGNDQRSNYLVHEKWATLTGRLKYERNLKQMLHSTQNSATINQVNKTSIKIFGRVLLRTNKTDTEFNFATSEHNKNGVGAALGHTCLNYHHPNSFWINALNGNQLDFTDLFITRFDDEDDNKRIFPALSSSALFGLPVLNKNTTSCSITMRKGKLKAGSQEPTYSSSYGIGTQRIRMGEQLGEFDVSVFNGEGFFIKHVRSGESIEATIINSNIGQDDTLIVVESYIFDFTQKRNTKTLLLKSLESSFSKLKSASLQKNAIINPPIFHNERTYVRNAAISDLQGRTMSCELEIIQVERESTTNNNLGQDATDPNFESREGKRLGRFNCLPATYGPTALNTFFLNSDNNVYEAELYTPNKDDDLGCTPNLEEINAFNYSTEPRIEMVNRGVCNFRNKAMNIGSRNNVIATIVVNTENKLFVMGGNDDGYDYEKEPASIMVTKDAGAEMVRAVEKAAAANTKIKARINLMPLKNNENYNDEEINKFWPRIRSSPDAVEILASQGWGVTAQSTSGQWALYILEHDKGSDKHKTTST